MWRYLKKEKYIYNKTSSTPCRVLAQQWKAELDPRKGKCADAPFPRLPGSQRQSETAGNLVRQELVYCTTTSIFFFSLSLHFLKYLFSPRNISTVWMWYFYHIQELWNNSMLVSQLAQISTGNNFFVEIISIRMLKTKGFCTV